MNWGAYSALFGLATVKFMFAALPGPAFNLSFIETYFCVFTGGSLSAAIFYFSSNLFMIKSKEKRIQRMIKYEAAGKKIKKFTFKNKLIVRSKHRFGKYVICFWAPFFLSVPLGTIIVAKFYRRMKFTFLYVLSYSVMVI